MRRADPDAHPRRARPDEGFNAIWLASILAVFIVGCAGAPSLPSASQSDDATQPSGTGVVLSLADLHFDPFYDSTLFPALVRSAPAEWTPIFEGSQVAGYGQYGKDSNYNLFVSALRHAALAAPQAEIILLAGDWLAHGFADSYYEHAGNRDPQGLYEFIDKTIVFVTQRIREQFPRAAIYPALGNEDSYCGDYQLQPGGEFLRRTAETWKVFFNNGDNERAFMHMFPTGGYYTVSAPGTPKHRVIVLNTVFFSADYQNRCGNPKDDPAGDEIRWLAAQLKDAATKEERVWLLYHIPPGIDAFNTAVGTSGNPVVSLWQAGYLKNFLALLDQYRDTIIFTLAGHTHMDDFRLARDGRTNRPSFLVVTPAISPIFQNNPGLQVLSYDRKTFSVLNYTTHQLDLAAAPLPHWKEEYRFSQAYHLSPVNGSTFETLFRSLQKDAPSRAMYIRYYNVSNTASPAITDQTWPIYWCAIDQLTVEAFEACRQRFSQPSQP